MGRIRITKQITPTNPPADTGEIFVDSSDDLPKYLDESGTLITLGGGTTYTNEEAQDAIGTILVDSSTIDFTYNDGVPSITAVVLPGGISHTTITDIGTNTHAQIDTHIANTSNPHSVTAAQIGAAVTTTTITAGIGLSGGGDFSGNRIIDLDVNDITSEPSPASNDLIAIYDTSATATRKSTIAQINSVIDHGTLAGLSDDDHTQYGLLAGRSGGQILTGGTASGDDLTLRSTTNGTKGNIIIDETTTSTSPTTGALIVGGGVGVAGNIAFGGGLYLTSGNTVLVNTTHTVLAGEYVLHLDSSGAAFNLTLSAPSTRQSFILKDITGNLSTNPVTVVRAAAESIDGIAASKVLRTNFGSWLFVSNGTNWFVL